MSKNRLAAQGPLVGVSSGKTLTIPEDDDDGEEEGSEFYDSADSEERYQEGESEDGEDRYNPKASVVDSSHAGGHRARTYERDDATSFVGDNNDRNYNRPRGDSRASSFGEQETRVRAGSDTIVAGDASFYDGNRSRASSGASSFIGNKQQAHEFNSSHGSETDSDRRSDYDANYESYDSRGSRRSHRSRRSGYAESSVSRPGASRRRRSRSKRDKSNRRGGRRGGEMEEGDEEMSYKVVMVGIVGVGKKSLMKRFGGAEFSSSEISKMSKHFISSDVERYIIKTWDDKGQVTPANQVIRMPR